jgi:hypothetical protein
MELETLNKAVALKSTIEKTKRLIVEVNEASELGPLTRVLYEMNPDGYHDLLEPLKKEMLNKLNRQLNTAETELNNL